VFQEKYKKYFSKLGQMLTKVESETTAERKKLRLMLTRLRVSPDQKTI
jgi:hypothetical protein